ncbi:MAG: hypothetical protein Q4B09_03995, partial [Lachnospiraceae bacterium]|nr:hypothetical protein [Lachnospiraceae bacterium]
MHARTKTDYSVLGMISLQLYCAYIILSATDYPNIIGRQAFRLLWLGLLGFIALYAVLQDEITLFQLVICTAVLALAFYITRVVETNRLFLQMSLVLLLAGVPFRKIVKNVFFATAFWTSFVAVSCAAGILRDYTYRHVTGFGTLTARTLGFNYYSYFAYMTLALTLMYLYLRDRRCTYIELAILAAVHVLLYFRIHTTALVMLTAEGLLVLFVICVKWRWICFKSRIWEMLGMLLPWAIFGGTWFLVWSYQHQNYLFAAFQKQFATLASRLKMSGDAYQLYGIRLFGNRIVLEGNSYVNYETMKGGLYIDSNYVYLPIVYGALFTAVFLLLLSLLYRYIYRLQQPYLFLWFGIILVIAVVNNFLLH